MNEANLLPPFRKKSEIECGKQANPLPLLILIFLALTWFVDTFSVSPYFLAMYSIAASINLDQRQY